MKDYTLLFSTKDPNDKVLVYTNSYEGINLNELNNFST